MKETPDSFVFKDAVEKIVPKRVGVVLEALDSVFGKYDIDVPAEVELEGMNKSVVEQADEEEVAKYLHARLGDIQNIIDSGDISGMPSVEDQMQTFVLEHKLFVPFLSRARFMQTQKSE